MCRSPATLVYNGPIRAGSYGRVSATAHSVYRCAACSVEFLNPPPDVEYESESYRSDYNDSVDVASYFKAQDGLAVSYFALLSRYANFRDAAVADFGCGGGSFLDAVAGQTRATIAVEPFVGYHESLRARGHSVYSYGADFLSDAHRPAVDIAVSLHVLEHVPDPIAYLREIREALAPTGVAFVLTPNSDNILLRLDAPGYRSFDYRTVHRWYFNGASLQRCARYAGFDTARVFYQHNYDLSNAVLWLRDGRPTGCGALPMFDERINDGWSSFLEGNGMADTVWIELRP
jgi:2-polyprenyl-3-methyl-5-hydroxy-6-metoxy-1,4-benzoquinol methylase